MHRREFPFALLLSLAMTAPAFARHGEPPYSLSHPAKIARSVPVADVGTIDAAARRAEADARQRARAAAPTKRLATADDIAVSIGSDRDGAWELLADGSRLWRMRVRAAGATDLRVAFAHLALPRDATLYLIGAGSYYQGPYTAVDAPTGEFHSPAVPGDTATIELRLPAGAAQGDVEIDRVGAGFRDLFKAADDTGIGTSGPCNVDVVCPLGDPYADEIRAVAYYEFDDDEGGVYLCSGTLLADVPGSRRNWFLTAAHCVSSASEAASMVLYWNYESAQCGALVAPPGGFFGDDQHRATLRATRADTDFTLVELDAAPDPDWNVYYAGWDASGTAPSGTIGIHHPSGDVKKITAGPRPDTIDSCIGAGTRTHWETGPYSQGTTEAGSSGSGLFVHIGNGGRDGRLIGTLSGGYAACSLANPGQPNDETDCYGKLASAWNGSSSASRLRDWLDPGHSGTLTAPGIDSHATAPRMRGHSHHRRPDRLPFDSRR